MLDAVKGWRNGVIVIFVVEAIRRAYFAVSRE
jgi:hypothetical protein